MTKRAVCVGINNYSARGYNTLNASLKDAAGWAKVLVDAFGYDASNITSLTDGAATRQAVLSAVTTMLNQSAAGDVACFYFSGHGSRSQSADASTWYEGICCADVNGDITNQTFDSLAGALSPSTVNFTLVLDSCHSGGVFDANVANAKTPTMSSDQIQAFINSCTSIVPHVLTTDVSKFANNVQITKGDSGSPDMTSDDALNFSDSATATLFAACGYKETALDGTTNSAFTQAMLDTINQCPFTIGHNDFLTQVRSAVKTYSSQTPQLRGRPVRLQENFLAGWNYSI